MRTNVVVHWAAVAAMSLAIWGLGSDGVSFETTSRIIPSPAPAWLFPGVVPATASGLHLYVRKMAHIAEYGVLSVLVLRALFVTCTMSLARRVALALGFVVVLAAADEGRQAVSRARKGAAVDVFLDVAGGCASLAAVRALPERVRVRLTRAAAQHTTRSAIQ